jgi:hypothetical protein
MATNCSRFVGFHKQDAGEGPMRSVRNWNDATRRWRGGGGEMFVCQGGWWCVVQPEVAPAASASASAPAGRRLEMLGVQPLQLCRGFGFPFKFQLVFFILELLARSIREPRPWESWTLALSINPISRLCRMKTTSSKV